jgi:hypothetical protein
VPAGGDADGSFFLVLSLHLDHGSPVLWAASLTTVGQPRSTELRLSLQAINATDRQTTVGSATQHGPFATASQGAFTATMPDLAVPAAANPFSDNELILSPSMPSTLCQPVDFLCGDATGMISAPITYDMAGSTFTLTRVDALESYPEPPVINCDGDFARPL